MTAPTGVGPEADRLVDLVGVHDQRRDDADHLAPGPAGQQQQPASARPRCWTAAAVAGRACRRRHGTRCRASGRGRGRRRSLGACPRPLQRRCSWAPRSAEFSTSLSSGSRRAWPWRRRTPPRWRRTCRPAIPARPSSISADDAAMPDSGNPHASPLAVTRMSGGRRNGHGPRTFRCGRSRSAPRRSTSRMPCRSARSRRPLEEPLVAPARSRPRRAPARRRTRPCRRARSGSAARSPARASAKSVAVSSSQP